VAHCPALQRTSKNSKEPKRPTQQRAKNLGATSKNFQELLRLQRTFKKLKDRSKEKNNKFTKSLKF
jgi:hypothetical protein